MTEGKWFLNDDGTPSGHRPIGYPMLLGLCYKLFGVNKAVAYSLNMILFVISAYLVYYLAEAIFSRRIAYLATLMFSIYPISIYSIVLNTDEHLFLPVWYLGLLLLFREIQGKPSRLKLLCYGLLFGYATMTRTHSIFMPLVVGFSYILLKYSWKRVLVGAMSVLVIMQLINLPWVIRNYKAWGVPVLYTATALYVYSQLNSSATAEGSGGHIPAEGELGYSEDLAKAMEEKNEGLQHTLANREMKKWIIKHPAEFLNLGICRVLVFMGWNRKGVWPIWFQYYDGSYDPKRPLPQAVRDVLEELAFVAYYLVFFSFIFSIFMLIRRRKKLSATTKTLLLVLGSCFIFWFAEHMIIYPDRKYRFPIEPLMIIVGAYFLEYIIFTFRWSAFKPGNLKKIFFPLRRRTP
ncbi:MAG: glycosyltransferase family 39 protein [Candidatus Omnitrophica bacterium]|nr:glycosyltransferase family 39 protein [Candidatus Omnitrophota bacterium]